MHNEGEMMCGKSKHSADSGSISSDSGRTRKGLMRQQLVEKTDSLMVDVLATLKSEMVAGPHHETELLQEKENNNSSTTLNQLVFDKKVDYESRVKTHSDVLSQLENLYKEHCDDNVGLLEDYLGSCKRLQREVELNMERLIARKRDDKLSRKELQKIKSLHPTTPMQLHSSMQEPNSAFNFEE